MIVKIALKKKTSKGWHQGILVKLTLETEKIGSVSKVLAKVHMKT